MFLYPGNFFRKDGTLSFWKDEVSLCHNFNCTLLSKCCCRPTTTHPSPKERDYCTHYWCCPTLNMKVIISEFIMSPFHLVYKDIPILAASSAGLASRKTLPCPAQIIDKMCSAALQIQEEKKARVIWQLGRKDKLDNKNSKWRVTQFWKRWWRIILPQKGKPYFTPCSCCCIDEQGHNWNSGIPSSRVYKVWVSQRTETWEDSWHFINNKMGTPISCKASSNPYA